jgi:predicted RNA-binding Zn ribbon-like protein
MLTGHKAITGESDHPRSRASPQPGGRQPAPGALALVQSFINTHFDLERDHGAELLSSAAAFADWLRRAGLIDRGTEVGDRDLVRALTLRESLRTLARVGTREALGSSLARERLNAVAAEARIEVRFAPEGPWFIGAPGAGVDGAVGALLAIVAQSIADGSWTRLKVCPGRHCGWAFYDHSRNRSGRWCSMSVCGGREKARAHYRRHRVEET